MSRREPSHLHGVLLRPEGNRACDWGDGGFALWGGSSRLTK